MPWKGTLIDKGLKGTLRAMHSPHDFEPENFQEGAFNTGQLWYSKLRAKGLKGKLAAKYLKGGLVVKTNG